MDKIPKLVSGKMNIPYIICKAGYAHGVRKPRRQLKAKTMVTKVITRKSETLIF